MANPSWLFLASVRMLNYMGQSEVLRRVYSAWLRKLKDSIHT